MCRREGHEVPRLLRDEGPEVRILSLRPILSMSYAENINQKIRPKSHRATRGATTSRINPRPSLRKPRPSLRELRSAR